jgi:hypothetical protein
LCAPDSGQLARRQKWARDVPQHCRSLSNRCFFESLLEIGKQMNLVKEKEGMYGSVYL